MIKLPKIDNPLANVINPIGVGGHNVFSNIGNMLSGANQTGQSSQGITQAQLDAASQQGLQLGQTITGQDINATGTQIQDLLQKQLALTNQGGNNPLTAAMQANKAQAIAATNQDLRRAGVKGGAAAAARLQTSRKMDRDIASQAYQQHQDALKEARNMMGGIASAQLAPKYQEQQAAIAANTPVFQPQKPGILGSIFQGIF
jgi:hypothetical protein